MSSPQDHQKSDDETSDNGGNLSYEAANLALDGVIGEGRNRSASSRASPSPVRQEQQHSHKLKQHPHRDGGAGKSPERAAADESASGSILRAPDNDNDSGVPPQQQRLPSDGVVPSRMTSSFFQNTNLMSSVASIGNTAAAGGVRFRDAYDRRPSPARRQQSNSGSDIDSDAGNSPAARSKQSEQSESNMMLMPTAVVDFEGESDGGAADEEGADVDDVDFDPSDQAALERLLEQTHTSEDDDEEYQEEGQDGAHQLQSGEMGASRAALLGKSTSNLTGGVSGIASPVKGRGAADVIGGDAGGFPERQISAASGFFGSEDDDAASISRAAARKKQKRATRQMRLNAYIDRAARNPAQHLWVLQQTRGCQVSMRIFPTLQELRSYIFESRERIKQRSIEALKEKLAARRRAAEAKRQRQEARRELRQQQQQQEFMTARSQSDFGPAARRAMSNSVVLSHLASSSGPPPPPADGGTLSGDVTARAASDLFARDSDRGTNISRIYRHRRHEHRSSKSSSTRRHRASSGGGDDSDNSGGDEQSSRTDSTIRRRRRRTRRHGTARNNSDSDRPSASTASSTDETSSSSSSSSSSSDSSSDEEETIWIDVQTSDASVVRGVLQLFPNIRRGTAEEISNTHPHENEDDIFNAHHFDYQHVSVSVPVEQSKSIKSSGNGHHHHRAASAAATAPGALRWAAENKPRILCTVHIIAMKRFCISLHAHPVVNLGATIKRIHSHFSAAVRKSVAAAAAKAAQQHAALVAQQQALAAKLKLTPNTASAVASGAAVLPSSSSSGFALPPAVKPALKPAVATTDSTPSPSDPAIPPAPPPAAAAVHGGSFTTPDLASMQQQQQHHPGVASAAGFPPAAAAATLKDPKRTTPPQHAASNHQHAAGAPVKLRGPLLTVPWLVGALLELFVDATLPDPLPLLTAVDAIDELVLRSQSRMSGEPVADEDEEGYGGARMSRKDASKQHNELIGNIARIRRVLFTHRGIINRKEHLLLQLLSSSMKTSRLMEHEGAHEHYKIVLSSLNRISRRLEDAREALSQTNGNLVSLISTEQSQTANEMSATMKLLSLVTIATIPLTLLTGLFGSNIRVPANMVNEDSDITPFIIMSVAMVAWLLISLPILFYYFGESEFSGVGGFFRWMVDLFSCACCAPSTSGSSSSGSGSSGGTAAQLPKPRPAAAVDDEELQAVSKTVPTIRSP